MIGFRGTGLILSVFRPGVNRFSPGLPSAGPRDPPLTANPFFYTIQYNMTQTLQFVPIRLMEERDDCPDCAQPGEGPIMDELESGKQKFIEMVKEIDSGVSVVIPAAPTNSVFLISLTKGTSRKFITVSEDDIVDLVSDDLIRSEVEDRVRETIAAL
jgi:hypothetical protein